jgi:hypothetical protein
VLAAILLASILPLLQPGLPPLTDLPGHVARWHIATAGPESPLHLYYRIQRGWIGNLGTDLIALPLIPLIGPVAAARLMTVLIMLLTGAAMLWLSREVHGRIAPAALFALPFAYGWPFQMGFVNFALAQALALAALACIAGFLVLPRLLLGGSYVDMRMMPAIWILALLSIRPPAAARLAGLVALAGLAFFVTRTAATTISFMLRAGEQRAELAALPAIPRGTALLSLVARPCLTPWSDIRPEHLAGHAILVRDAFANEQWAIPGQHYIGVRYSRAAPFETDPSQLVYPDGCREQGHSLSHALATFPRAAFSHVWIIGHRLAAPRHFGLVTVWSNGRSGLYEVVGARGNHRVEPGR